MKRAVLYPCVSTHDQTTANQERELRQVAERGQVVHVYRDRDISGTNKTTRDEIIAIYEPSRKVTLGQPGLQPLERLFCSLRFFMSCQGARSEQGGF
jgi:hypothetical protein